VCYKTDLRPTRGLPACSHDFTDEHFIPVFSEKLPEVNTRFSQFQSRTLCFTDGSLTVPTGIFWSAYPDVLGIPEAFAPSGNVSTDAKIVQ
jgi:hypothetical protein